MVEKSFVKDPDAVLDYAFDWTEFYLQSGETISAHTVSVETGLTKDSDSETDGVVTVWLSGGTVQESYLVECEIVTSLGRTEERSIYIAVEDR